METYLVLTVGAIVVYLLARRGEYQNCYQDYRAIAEGLRIQDYWQRANIPETVADHYLRQHRGELDWIRNAIRVCRVLDQAARSDDRFDLTTRMQRLAAACHEWIGNEQDGQLAFFENRIRRQERGAAVWGWIAGVLLLSTFMFALLALYSGVQGRTLEIIITLIALAAVGAGLSHGYANIRAYKEHAKQYRRMRGFFLRAKARVSELLARDAFCEQDYCDVQRILQDLGAEALSENAAWVILHRERPVEYPHGS